jgi:hypothetical protein
MEKKPMNVNKTLVVQTIVNSIENKGEVREIKTSLLNGYKPPEKITRKDSVHKGFTPDVISEMLGRTDLYEVELDEKKYIPEKWKLFSLYTKKHKGIFNIVIPETNLEVIRKLLQLHDINAKILYFN